MYTFYLGNILRGYFETEAASIDTARKRLSARFKLSYPGNRSVGLFIKKINEFGIEAIVPCWEGFTDDHAAEYSERYLLSKARRSNMIFL